MKKLQLAIWDPANESIQTEPMPAEINENLSFGKRLIAVNHGKNLLLYGGIIGVLQPLKKTIWKYDLASKTWSEIGEMLKGRHYLDVLPVHGLDCGGDEQDSRMVRQLTGSSTTVSSTAVSLNFH